MGLCALLLLTSPFAGAAGMSCPDFYARLTGALPAPLPASGKQTLSQVDRPPRTTLSYFLARPGSHYTLGQLLEESRIPLELRKFYDAKGRFHYHPEHPVRLSSENGDQKVSVFKIHYDPSSKSEDAELHDLLLRDYAGVLERMPDTKLWVVTRPAHLQRLEELLATLPPETRARIRPSSLESESVQNRYLGLWAQDSSKPVDSPDGTPHVLVPWSQRFLGPTSPDDTLELQFALAAHGQTNVHSPLLYSGGNVIVGERHVLVGPDVVRNTADRLRIPPSDALDALSAEFGKPVIEIFHRSAPEAYSRAFRRPFAPHIDLQLALARDHSSGKETALVQSPAALVTALLGGRKAEELPAEWPRFVDALVRGAHPDPARALNASEEALIAALGAMRREDLLAQQDQAQELARSLAAKGYAVRTVPGIAPMKYESENAGTKWQLFNYTNSIFSGDRAVIPDLGIPALDRAFRDELGRMGYQPVPVTSPRRSYRFWGGIRCMTETHREPPSNP